MVKEKERKRYYAPIGSHYENKFAMSIDDNGHKTLRKTGEKVNVYELIQAHRDEVDLEKLIERIETEGNEILDRRSAMTGDVTAVPKSMLEASQLMQSAENDFNKLPIDLRRQFNFSFNEYLAAASNNPEEWTRKMFGEPEKIINEPEPIPEQKGDE